MNNAECVYIVRGYYNYIESNVKYFSLNKDDANKCRNFFLALGCEMEPIETGCLTPDIFDFSSENIKVFARFDTVKEITERPEITSISDIVIIPAEKDETVGTVSFTTIEREDRSNYQDPKIYRGYMFEKVFQRKTNEPIKNFHMRIVKYMKKELDRQLNINNIKFDYRFTDEKYHELRDEMRDRYYRELIRGK